jgi:hypothetical protein
MAGPCSVESREQIFHAAEVVSSTGARFLRGGAFKVRTSPTAFQGLGWDGWKLLREAADAFSLLTVSEILTRADRRRAPLRRPRPVGNCMQNTAQALGAADAGDAGGLAARSTSGSTPPYVLARNPTW